MHGQYHDMSGGEDSKAMRREEDADFWSRGG